MNRLELQMEAKRRNVAEFVRRNSVPIELRRVVRVDDGVGGKIDAVPRPLPIQYFRVVDPQVKRAPPEHKAPPVGEIFNFDLELIGLWDADVQEGDTFLYGDSEFKVTHVSLNAQDRTIAGAKYFAGP